jgi:hypothetical protein
MPGDLREWVKSANPVGLFWGFLSEAVVSRAF